MWLRVRFSSRSKNPNVVDACTSDNRLQVLQSLSERLDTCQKSLSDYLNTKRSSFPRFFFISDDELLSVLGNSDPTSIQIHLLKLFDNVKEMQFGRNNKVAKGIITHSLMHSALAFIYLLTHPVTRSLTHSPTHPLTHPRTYSLAHSTRWWRACPRWRRRASRAARPRQWRARWRAG